MEHILSSILAADRWALVSIAFVVVAIVTRIVSSAAATPKKTSSGINTVPMVPYWVPIIGHAPSLLFNGDKLFGWARKAYSHGIFSLNLGGTVHNFIIKPSIGSVLMNQKAEVADAEHVTKHFMTAIFGFPLAESDKYDRAIKDVLECYRHLMSNPGLSEMVETTSKRLCGTIGNFVTFNDSPVDQENWERTAKAHTVAGPDGTLVVEASML